MTGQELRREVEQLGLLHAEAAELLKVSKRQFQRWLTLKKVPPRGAMLRLYRRGRLDKRDLNAVL